MQTKIQENSKIPKENAKIHFLSSFFYIIFYVLLIQRAL